MSRRTQMLFMGDSLNRHMFHRLVWYIRGIEAVIEHYCKSTHGSMRRGKAVEGQLQPGSPSCALV